MSTNPANIGLLHQKPFCDQLDQLVVDAFETLIANIEDLGDDDVDLDEEVDCSTDNVDVIATSISMDLPVELACELLQLTNVVHMMLTSTHITVKSECVSMSSRANGMVV